MPLIISGIQLSYSRNGPFSGREKCNHSATVFAIPFTALITLLIMERIPSTNPCIKSRPHCNAFPGKDVIKSTANCMPFFTASPILCAISLTFSSMFENASLTRCTILSTTLRNPSQLSYSSLKAPANGFTSNIKRACQLVFTNSITELNAFGIVTVKNSTIAVTTPEINSFTFSHISITPFRKFSFVFHRVISAATTPAISVAIKTNGFAFIAMFNACIAVFPACNAVTNPFIAVITVIIIDATFHATNPAAMPVIIETIRLPLSTKKLRTPDTLAENAPQSTEFCQS